MAASEPVVEEIPENKERSRDTPSLLEQATEEVERRLTSRQVKVSRDQQHQSLVDGLKEAAPMLESADITLVIEPLNELVDHAGYYLTRSDEAFDIIDEVASSHVKVVFDIYHQQISEGHIIHNITSNIEKIGHFHSAGNPGRHELSHGEINYPVVFDAIRKTNYEGFVGLEYWPLKAPEIGLKEVASWF